MGWLWSRRGQRGLVWPRLGSTIELILLSLQRHGGAVPSTVASQQDGRGLDVNPGLSVWSLDILPVMMWDPSRSSGSLPQSTCKLVELAALNCLLM